VVPDTAILSDQGLRYILVPNKDNVVIRRNVSLGRLLEDGQRVIRPVKDGDDFVTADEWISWTIATKPEHSLSKSMA
jgi:hypothetical protein